MAGDDLIERLRMDAEMICDGRQKNLTDFWHKEVAQGTAKDCLEAAARLTALEQENKRLREAVEPSGDTKAAYIGEFSFEIEDRDEDGNECQRKVSVPWTTIKEIMAAIRSMGERG